MRFYWIIPISLMSVIYLVLLTNGEFIRNPECNLMGVRFDFIRKVRLLIAPLAEFIDIPAKHCVRKCVDNLECKSVGYAKSNSTCLLYSKSIQECEFEVEPNKNWTHYESDKTNKLVSFKIFIYSQTQRHFFSLC